MGGLVAWSVIDQMQSFQGEQGGPLKLVFSYGTPYEGTSLNAAAYAALGEQNKQIYALLPAKENPFLNELENKYRHSSTQQAIDLSCAYETNTTYGAMIVDSKSATAFCDAPAEYYVSELKHLPGKKTKYKIPGNHEELIRPDSPAYPANFNALKASIIESSKKWKQR
jgi:hypothetical protein